MTKKGSAADNLNCPPEKIPDGLFHFVCEQELQDNETYRRYEIEEGNLFKLLHTAYYIIKNDECYDGYKPHAISIELSPLFQKEYNGTNISFHLDKQSITDNHLILEFAKVVNKLPLKITWFILWTETKKYIGYSKNVKPSWRKQVLKEGKCACCGGDKHLEAHHIFAKANYPELMDDVDNGIALCKWCHKKYHSYYGNDANPVTLINFIRRFGTVNKDMVHGSIDEMSEEVSDS